MHHVVRRIVSGLQELFLPLIAVGAIGLASLAPAQAGERFITLASTTSTDNSGLFAYLLPIFEAKTGIAVRVVAVGTGQAIRIAQNGDADVILVHHKPSEEKLVADGHGIKRYDVMYNDFIVVGPADDPAGLATAANAADAFRRIGESAIPFTSRGDDSGTNKAEKALWKASGIDPAAASGDWYRELGAGMGATLNAAVAMDAYALSDRGTWLGFANKGSHRIVYEGDKALFNQYGVIVIDPKKHPHVKVADAQTFADWLIDPEGQAAIAAFRLHGEQAFFPNGRGAPVIN
ncbi:substrate-binding domain-containing protein [Oceanibacterium hippocampi]|uniref:PBP superfamily domain protein n=1 Tax=Oceanibacterium hippocampi TaxID=745714 RepID=A0A1Y5T762_9PROT|nr:substrate-binding domain-containing protein [Oceanibacterium hippocampi]SLN57399.1 PBP superfamily domain protein [Oceanibacterium hippocampi]